MTKPFIEISKTVDGQIQTIYRPVNGDTPITMGMALASATRVFAEAMRTELNLGPEHREQIEAIVAEVYANDLKMGDMGEAESTEVKQ